MWLPRAAHDLGRRRVLVEQHRRERRALLGLDRADDLDQQALARPEVVDEHPVAGAERGGEAAQAEVADAVLGDVLHRAREQALAGGRAVAVACGAASPRILALRCSMWYMYRTVHLSDLSTGARHGTPAHRAPRHHLRRPGHRLRAAARRRDLALLVADRRLRARAARARASPRASARCASCAAGASPAATRSSSSCRTAASPTRTPRACRSATTAATIDLTPIGGRDGDPLGLDVVRAEVPGHGRAAAPRPGRIHRGVHERSRGARDGARGRAQRDAA